MHYLQGRVTPRAVLGVPQCRKACPMEKRIYRTRIRGGFMKMRLTPPVAAQSAWLIAGRSAAGAVLLAITVSACTGGGSSVPSIFTPTPRRAGSSSSQPGTRTPSPAARPRGRPAAHRRARRRPPAAARRRRLAARVEFLARVALIAFAPRRAPRRHDVRRPRTPTHTVAPRRTGGPDAHVGPGLYRVPHGRAGDRRRRHGRPAGRPAVRGRRRARSSSASAPSPTAGASPASSAPTSPSREPGSTASRRTASRGWPRDPGPAPRAPARTTCAGRRRRSRRSSRIGQRERARLARVTPP